MLRQINSKIVFFKFQIEKEIPFSKFQVLFLIYEM